MGLQRHAARARLTSGLDEQAFRTGIDLRRAEKAAYQPIVGAVETIDVVERAHKPALTLRLIKLPGDAAAIVGNPATRAKALRDVAANAIDRCARGNVFA